jgi:hypothetical protein
MSDQEEITIEQPVAYNLTQEEKHLRDQFVKQYKVDHNILLTSLRMGYPRNLAAQYGTMLFNDSYVQQQLAKAELKIETPEDEAAIKQRVVLGLLREADYTGPGASQSARVAAFGRLATIFGMDAPTRSKTELTGADGQPLNAGGVFVVPGIVTAEEWEKAAAAQQAALTAPETPSIH